MRFLWLASLIILLYSEYYERERSRYLCILKHTILQGNYFLQNISTYSKYHLFNESKCSDIFMRFVDFNVITAYHCLSWFLYFMARILYKSLCYLTYSSNKLFSCVIINYFRNNRKQITTMPTPTIHLVFTKLQNFV